MFRPSENDTKSVRSEWLEHAGISFPKFWTGRNLQPSIQPGRRSDGLWRFPQFTQSRMHHFIGFAIFES